MHLGTDTQYCSKVVYLSNSIYLLVHAGHKISRFSLHDFFVKIILVTYNWPTNHLSSIYFRLQVFCLESVFLTDIALYCLLQSRSCVIL